MRMWQIIFVVLIVTTVLALLFVGNRVGRLNFIADKTQGRIPLRNILGILIVSCVFTTLILTLNLMNAVTCLLHFAVLWAVCDGVFWAARLSGKAGFTINRSGLTAVCLSVAALVAGWVLAHHVWATRYVIETDKDVAPLRIVQFADSHIGTTFDGKGLAEHVARMQAENPDIVLITGDFVDDDTSRADMIDAAAALGQFKTTYGVYFSFGNHDEGYYGPAHRGFSAAELAAELKKNNVKVLKDDVLPVGADYIVIGRLDASEKMRGRKRKSMAELMNGQNAAKFSVVMDHQPNDYKNQAAAKVDLVMSGHTHGGQLWPLNKVGEWIKANDKTYGFERRDATNFVVTSGLSDWAMRFKTGTKSEYVVLDVTRSSTSSAN